ncbi:hypothetical protein C2E23DRAFT_803485 [Lenzites betulinus]|nr:hypothetical protein C2E23DRAFT_803485 [Lenzites betulinus]
MMSKLSFVAALALAPWASALLLATPVDWHSSSPANVSWSSSPSDAVFSLVLFNTLNFHDTFAIANNVNPTANFAEFTLPVIPVGTYTLQAINVTNNTDIFDQTPQFQVGAPLSTTSTSASSTSSSAASASASSGSGSGSAAGSATVTVPPGSSSTGGFGVTVSASSTPSGSGASASNTNSAAATSSSAAAAPANFNGAASLSIFAPWAIAALGVVGGAAAML